MNNESMRWYHTWWGVMLTGLVVMLLASIVALTTYTVIFWKQIKQGKGAELSKQFSQGFTALPTPATSATGVHNRSEIETTDSPQLGTPGALVTIVEFVDFKCPNCLTAAPILRQMLAKYGRQVNLIIRNFPIDSLHPGAGKLAELAYCAHKQNRFWQLHDILFQEQDQLPGNLASTDIDALANRADLNRSSLQTCLNSPDTDRSVQRDYLDGIRFGVRGTPTFFVNGQKLEGVVPLDAWDQVIAQKK